MVIIKTRVYKLISSLRALFAAREGWAGTYSDFTANLPSGPCSVGTVTIANFSEEVFCKEGTDFNEGEICTLECPPGKAPIFAELICQQGELSPPGFFKNMYWSPLD